MEGCPICYESIREQVVFECTHSICSDCWKQYILRNITICPICRKIIHLQYHWKHILKVWFKLFLSMAYIVYLILITLMVDIKLSFTIYAISAISPLTVILIIFFVLDYLCV